MNPTLFEVDSRTRTIQLHNPRWRESLRITRVATCEIYNSMEAQPQWVDAEPLWEKLSRADCGWMLPCRVSLPYVGVVLEFEIVAIPLADGVRWRVTVRDDALVELQPGFGKLLRLDLFPGFSPATPGEEGYLFLPCNTGVLHHFNKTVAREKRITLYTRQEQWTLHSDFNCFGMHRNDASWCAMVSQGDADAEAVARSHWDASSTYSIHAGLVYRWDHQDTRLGGDRSILFCLLDPAAGGWQEFARQYRTFLREERGLRTWKEKEGNPAELDHFARGFLLKIFQGHKELALDGRGAYHSATTFAEARDILATIQTDGIERITAQMVGWNFEGHDGRYPQRFPVNPVEGGEEEFKRLIQWGREHDCVITVHDNCYDAYDLADNLNRDDLVVLRDGTVWRNIPWSGGFVHKICPRCGLNYLRESFPHMHKLGIRGNYYLDALGAFYPCHSPKHPATRGEFFAAMRDMLAYTRKEFGTLSAEFPFGPYTDLLDGAYIDNVPFESTDVREWFDEVVPAMPIALHNSLRYHQTLPEKSGLARTLEDVRVGAMPFFEISARPIPGPHVNPTYAEVRDYAVSSWNLSCQRFGDRALVDLHSIETLGEGLSRTIYADGRIVAVNSTGQPQNIGGKLVKNKDAVYLE